MFWLANAMQLNCGNSATQLKKCSLESPNRTIQRVATTSTARFPQNEFL